MDRVLQTRVRRLLARPLEFWPFQAGLAADERAVRASRGLLYVGAVYAYQGRSWRAGAWPVAAAALLLLLLGRPGSIRLDDASLRTDPNPAGNAPVGDLRGRNPDVPATPQSLSMPDFVRRMQEPIRADDYAILPVAAPNQAHQVFGEVTPFSDIQRTRTPAPLPARS